MIPTCGMRQSLGCVCVSQWTIALPLICGGGLLTHETEKASAFCNWFILFRLPAVLVSLAKTRSKYMLSRHALFSSVET